MMMIRDPPSFQRPAPDGRKKEKLDQGGTESKMKQFRRAAAWPAAEASEQVLADHPEGSGGE